MTMTEIDNETGTGGANSLKDKASAARDRASEAYEAARERTSAAYESAREGAGRAKQRTSDGINSNPVAALIGGLALGGLIAAILPKTNREEELLGDYGRRINEKAREAARAARDAGTSKLDELGYNRDMAKDKIESLKSDAAEVARAAAERARSSSRPQS
ncbi:MAG: hypothetical protein H0W74_02490 [Sphingosinicella sp.]|nr:hypothetical protein [Sphingosinicella sp.]